MKEGFFPNLERKGNIRYFSDNELEALRIIECLKKSGLEIKDIKQFFIWVSEGSSSYKKKELFEARKSAVETESYRRINKLNLCNNSARQSRHLGIIHWIGIRNKCISIF